MNPDVILLKKNRGGSRIFNLRTNESDIIPAQLSETKNSVGVGDLYSSVIVGFGIENWREAAWRGAMAATAYSQTTYPDDFRRDVARGLKLSLEELRDPGGTVLSSNENLSEIELRRCTPALFCVHFPTISPLS
ncbi:hypothetical protein FHT86_004348 [Rhizobium sp. BK313]|uniref:hypothetical protein n=1 Tax=Rhizobium sp. BK313 TaxID=2587081 RepID=UPI00105E7CF8|nr:hypothetical protein [Rhizobium sp. BK313]MBB3456040.1 hypothetical protein [Rhizobium sp. BK313]